MKSCSKSTLLVGQLLKQKSETDTKKSKTDTKKLETDTKKSKPINKQKDSEQIDSKYADPNEKALLLTHVNTAIESINTKNSVAQAPLVTV